MGNSKSRKNYDEKIINWLAQVNETNTENIKNILENESATQYLMVWSVFEQKVFKEGYMQKKIFQRKLKNITMFMIN